MNGALEQIGRLDPVRSAARFHREFQPGVTRLIHRDGAFAGCVTAYPADDGDWVIEHFYLVPEHQGRGLGDTVIRRLLDEADAAGAAVRLSVLVESDANRFYPRYGFVETHREAFDIYYRRPARDGVRGALPT
jgi:GNAT superfamily N-acetyltransferase